MKINDNKLVVVLGMHRSGTSAVTRGLQVLGVELGQNFLPPQGDNVTGFWEDVDLNALNIQMLSSLNRDWHFLTPIQSTDMDLLCQSGYFTRAIELLQEKMSGAEIFGFKDPRVAKLLPFWKEVFGKLQLKVSYVITIRHPLSVCKSLEKRHGFDFEKSSLLWLEHVINSLACTEGENRVIVNYDHLIQSPDTELKRVAKEIQLQIDFTELEKYKNEFLREELRHTIYHVDDLMHENSIPFLVQDVYSNLLKIAEGSAQLTDASIQIKIAQWTNEFSRLKPMLVFIDRLNSTIRTITEENAEQRSKFNEKIVAKDLEINAKHAELNAKDLELNAKHAELNAIYQSKSWRLAMMMRRLRLLLLPTGSFSENLVRLTYWTLKTWRDHGLTTLLHRARNRDLLQDSNTSLSILDYPDWIFNNEPSEKELAEQRETSRRLSYRPLISILTPVFNTPEHILRSTIQSVIDQTYDHWELCIANGSPEVANLRKVLDSYAKQDPRIKIVHLKDNLGIAGNTNAALNLATGDFIGFMDHDDLLASFALFEVVKRLQIDTTADLIYSDEDKIDKSGKRFDPFFKPDFSPDYLRSANYMPHFLFVRKSLGDTIGWFREGYDGAQDYDLILRSVEKARSIAHIPKILYHWRAWTESTASGAEVKPYANTSGKKALREHLDRIGQMAQVEDGYSSTFYRVHYQYSTTPLVSIIIPNHDHAEDLERCIASILQKTKYPKFEIVLVENGSKEQDTFDLYEQLKKDTRIRVITWGKPFNYSHVNNWAVTQANGEVILFLNNDTQVINGDWLEEMLQFAMRPDVGAVGAKLYYPDESIQHAGVIVGLGGVAGHGHKYYPRNHPGYFRQLEHPQNISAVTAACLMIRKQVFQEVNGFDENYPLAFGDVDFCLKILQKRYLNVWTPYAELYHHESKTRGNDVSPEKQARFRKEVDYFRQKWAVILEQGDRYYSPNLTLDREDYSLNPRKKPD